MRCLGESNYLVWQEFSAIKSNLISQGAKLLLLWDWVNILVYIEWAGKATIDAYIPVWKDPIDTSGKTFLMLDSIFKNMGSKE